MRYVTLLGPVAVQRVHLALQGFSAPVPLRNAAGLISELRNSSELCVVLDPALLTLTDAQEIVGLIVRFPLSVVVYTSVTKEAMELAVLFARRTSAEFIFAGSTDERAGLARALLLTPDVKLAEGLVNALQDHIAVLPVQLRDEVTGMLKTGGGPPTPDALARQSALPRRTMDRWLARAGFTSGRLLVASARVMGAYSAITSSKIPFRRIAAMIGYPTQRALDTKLRALFDRSSASLRAYPPDRAKAIILVAEHLTTQKHIRNADTPDSPDVSLQRSTAYLLTGERRIPVYTTTEKWQFPSASHDEGDM